jgi:hypothetical protein
MFIDLGMDFDRIVALFDLRKFLVKVLYAISTTDGINSKLHNVFVIVNRGSLAKDH